MKGFDFPKLTPLFVGPYLVKRVGRNTVQLEVPGVLSNNFSIKRIRHYHQNGRFAQENVLPPPIIRPTDSSIHLSLDRVLKERFAGPKRTIKQYLVSFQDYGPENNAWMSIEHLQNLFGANFKKLLSNFRKRNQ